MKKYIKYLLLFVLFLAIRVKADYSSTGIVPNYTTIPRGDTITFSIGNDYLWDENLILRDSEDDTDLIGELVKNEEGNYLAEPIYVVVDEDVFDIDISENKVKDSNYILVDYKKRSIDGSKKVYEFDFEIKELGESDDVNDGYDGVIDNIMVSNLKLNVSEDAKPGVYFIEVFRSYDFDDTYENDTYVKEYLPITVLDNDENEKGISKFTINTVSSGLIEKKEYNIDIEEDKFNYEKLYLGDIDYTNISCNSKCLVKGIGSDVYYDDEAKDFKYTVKYADNTEEKYTISNLRNKISINYTWAVDYGRSIIYISKDISTADSTIDKMLNYMPNFNNGYERYIYDYNKLNEYDKEVLSSLNENIDDTYIYVIDGNKIVYEHKGDLLDEEYDNIQEEITRRTELNNIDSSKISNCTDGKCSLENKDENIDIISLIKDNYMHIVIGLSVLIIILLLLITIIKKSKKNN